MARRRQTSRPKARPPKQLPSAAATAVVVKHLALVERVARAMVRRLPAHVRLDDLRSAGAEGLMDAAARFDPSRGKSFASFAEWRIKGAIYDDIREQDSLSRDMRRWANAIADAEHELHGRLGRQPTHDELARELGLTSDELDARRMKLAGHTVVGFDEAGPDFLDRFAGDQAPSGFDRIARAETCGFLEEAIAKLTPHQQQAISLYYGEGMTFEQVGAVFGITTSGACQVMAAALRNLRELVDPDLVQGEG